jgi:hypothetical protein
MTWQQARQYAEKRRLGDARRTVEIHRAATLPRDPGKAEIKGGRRGRRMQLQIRRGRFASTGLMRGAMDRIDIRPLHMSRTELIRASVPLSAIQGDQHALKIRPQFRVADPEQGIRRLCFCLPEIFSAVQSKQVGHCVVRSRLRQPRLPAKRCRCVTHRGDDMAKSCWQ